MTLWIIIPEVVLLGGVRRPGRRRRLKDPQDGDGVPECLRDRRWPRCRSSRSSRSRPRTAVRPAAHQPVPFALGPQPAERSRPDIYYIILDGYARPT